MNFLERFRGSRVLVTGNTGFKGSWLTLWLKSLGADVLGVSIDTVGNDSLFVDAQISSIVETEFFDIRDFQRLRTTVSEFRPDFIFHLAAQSIVSDGLENPLETFSVNAMGSANLLEVLRSINVNKLLTVIMITSDKCYENTEQIYGYREHDVIGGKDPYSASKGCAELIISSFVRSYLIDEENIRIGVARAGNVIGGGDWTKDRIVPDCYRAWSQNKCVELRAPGSTRPWQHVLEPLSGYLCLASALNSSKTIQNGEAFNFGPQQQNVFDVDYLVRELRNEWKRKHPDLLSRNIMVATSDNFASKEAKLLHLDITKAQALLNWKPKLSFSEVCKFTSDWYLNFFENRHNSFDFSMEQIAQYMEKP